MQCRSYSTLTDKEFLYHALNLLAEASLIEIETEHILAGIEILEARVVLISLAYLKRSYDSLELCQQWVRRWLEWLQVIIQCLEITGITCQYQRNQHKVALVETTVNVLLDCLPAFAGAGE